MPVRKKKGEKRVKISVTIKPDLYDWIEQKIADEVYYNKSHVIQKALKLLQKQEE